MRDDPSDARDMRDADHMWLRQSVTFTVNGQTRTIELALPLRPGATPDEVEALLDEADAGMRRLSRRLDAHLAEMSGAAHVEAPAASLAPTRPTPQPAAAPATSAPSVSRHETAPAPRPAASVPSPRPESEKPAPTEKAAPTEKPATSAPAGGPDLTRQEFLSATGALGLDARTVMERLNVRSLNGLNLREALDLLRRQVMRDGGGAAEASPAPAPASAAERPAEPPKPIGSPRFDEEDDSPTFELSYPDPDELPGDEEFVGEADFAPLEAPAAAPSASATTPLRDVPDLEELLNGAAKKVAEDTIAERAHEVIAQMRAAHPGGQATQHQRSAFQNVVIEQIGAAKAASVVRAIWDMTPDKLGPEQYDAFTRWGKADEFAEEVEAALTILRAEYAAARAAKQDAPAAQPTTQPATTNAASKSEEQKPAPRGRSSSARNAGGSRGGA